MSSLSDESKPPEEEAIRGRVGNQEVVENADGQPQ